MKFLIIQTAFLGDVVLATPIIEKIHQHYPNAVIDFVLRKGNESLLRGHPHLRHVYQWRKKKAKYQHLFQLLKKIRAERYDVVINTQRFFSSGLLAGFSKGKTVIGFDKNPLSLLFHKTVKHQYGTKQKPIHEVERNLQLVAPFTDETFVRPRLYPLAKHDTDIPRGERYITIAPASVWATKQLPADKWIAFINVLPTSITIYLLGGKGDDALCKHIQKNTQHPNVVNKVGLSLLAAAAWMQYAMMNYANDSAPVHLASAVNAPMTAVFCSTSPTFGFTPLSDRSHIVETSISLTCKPCGIHGKKACPKGHFKCSEILPGQLLNKL